MGYTSLQLSRAFANINFYCSFNAKPQLLMGYTSLQLSRAFANINFYCSFNAKPQLLMGCPWLSLSCLCFQNTNRIRKPVKLLYFHTLQRSTLTETSHVVFL